MSFPPIHPALVHLPIAFVLLSVIADLCARLSRREPRRAMFRLVGFASLVAALAGVALTIAAGYLDMRRAALSPDAQELLDLHMAVGWSLGVTLLILTAWRWLIWHRGQMTINTSYLVGGFLLLALTSFQGWYGGEMVYSYGAGVAAAGQGTENIETAQSRLMAVHKLLQPGTAIGGGEVPGGTNASVPEPHPLQKRTQD